MECKTCENTLRSDFSYCPNCGAKIIKNRLTIKNLWQDIIFQVFNLDNTFIKTFKGLLFKPKLVTESFINGARKKYMNPISYFAISITLTGLMLYILKNWYGVNLTQSNFDSATSANMDFLFDYQGLISYLIMPLYALLTWILFLDKPKLNYTEHLIVNSYTTSQVLFIQVFVSLIVFGFFDINYQNFNLVALLLFVAYQFYVFKKIFRITFGSAFLRALGYTFMMMMSMFGIGILIIIIGFLTGTLNPEDLIQNNN